MDIGFDDGQGLGINDDGKVTFEEFKLQLANVRGISAWYTIRRPENTTGPNKES